MADSSQTKQGSLGKYLLWYGLGAALLVGSGVTVWLLARKAVRSVRRNAAENRAGADPDSAAAIAQAIHSAFQPWGTSWFWGGGTDEEMLYKLARNIRSKQQYADVGREYKRLYNENLQDRLLDELDSKEQQQFFSLLNLNNKPLKGTDMDYDKFRERPAPGGRLWRLRTLRPTTVCLPDGRRVKTVPAGLLLGEYLQEEREGYLFRTKDNQLRWVAKTDAVLETALIPQT